MTKVRSAPQVSKPRPADEATANAKHRRTIDPTKESIVYRESIIYRDNLARMRPFDQTKSNQRPVYAVQDGDLLYIMHGNHRVYGAALDGVTLEALVFTPDEWRETFGSVFVARGTNNPQVRSGSKPRPQLCR